MKQWDDLLTASEIERLISEELQKTRGASGEIYIRYTAPELSSEERASQVDAASKHAWTLAPSGGWGWYVALIDYLNKKHNWRINI